MRYATPTLTLVVMLIAGTAVAEIEWHTIHDEACNFTISVPGKPDKSVKGTMTDYNVAVGSPPTSFVEVMCITDIPKAKDPAGHLADRCTQSVANMGGLLLEDTPIRWKGHPGHRQFYVRWPRQWEWPLVSCAYFLVIEDKYYVILSTSVAFGFSGTPADITAENTGIAITQEKVAADALDMMRSFHTIAPVSSAPRSTWPAAKLRGSWIVRKALVAGKEMKDEIGTQYTFWSPPASQKSDDHEPPAKNWDGRFARVDKKVNSESAIGKALLFPMNGKIHVNDKTQWIDFPNNLGADSKWSRLAAYEFHGQTLLLAIGLPSEENATRPKDFTSTGENKLILLELTRPGDNPE